MGLIERLEAWLQGWPEGLLTLGLILATAWLVYIALTGSAVAKAASLAWTLAP